MQLKRLAVPAVAATGAIRCRVPFSPTEDQEVAAQHKIVDLAEYRRVRQPESPALPVAVAPAVVWVPVWVQLPAWRQF